MSDAVQILNTPGGDALAVMPLAEYQALRAAAEDAEDAALVRTRRNEPALPLDKVLAIRRSDLHPLAAWRDHAGLSQAQLAQKAGMRPATISDIERGASPSVAAATLKKLADVLGVGIDDLMADGVE